jgi:DUF2934 family protein
MTTIPIQFSSSILDELENVYDDITKRAYEKFLSRGCSGSIDIDDWLEAEREILLKPEARLVEKRGHYIVRFYLPKVNPSYVRVFLTADDLVVQSSGAHSNYRIFKMLHFPDRIDLRRVRTAWVRGRLIVVALKARISEASVTGTARGASVESHSDHK